MSLLKNETICKSCSTHYILVLQEEDVVNLSCCPFCSFPVEEVVEQDGEEE